MESVVDKILRVPEKGTYRITKVEIEELAKYVSKNPETNTIYITDPNLVTFRERYLQLAD